MSIMNGSGSTKFDYSIIVTDEFDTNVYTGQIRGNDLNSAARNVVRARTDWLDEGFGDVLEPVITISRDSDGNFIVDVESHGLGEAGIVLERIS